MTNTDKALETFRDGYNCAQAVFMTFAEPLGLDRETAAKLTSGFGGGMHIGSTCGAVTGAFMVIVWLLSATAPRLSLTVRVMVVFADGVSELFR